MQVSRVISLCDISNIFREWSMLISGVAVAPSSLESLWKLITYCQIEISDNELEIEASLDDKEEEAFGTDLDSLY